MRSLSQRGASSVNKVRLVPRVKARVIRVNSEIYERLEKEAQRRGMSPNALASELLTTALDRLGDS